MHAISSYRGIWSKNKHTNPQTNNKQAGPITAQCNDRGTGPINKFDDIFSRLDTKHERDRQTDGRTTPDDSKDGVYT